MRRALTLAARGRGAVEPNPMVAAVLVAKDGGTLAEGWHRRCGGPHAEIEALNRARDAGVESAALRQATLYVSLEPCCHHGKTPPCVDAVIAAGIRRVVVAMVDPNPRVAGRGIQRLRDAGIDVHVGLLENEARQLNEPFIKRHTLGVPWVIAKWAQTLDGAIAARTGDSRWISNDCSRRVVHQLRGRVDAVMVGIGTVLADDPALTARDVPRRRIARRVVVDPRLRLPLKSQLVRTVDQAPLLLAVSTATLRSRRGRVDTLRRAGVEIIALPQRRGRNADLDLGRLLTHLADEHDATNVLAEGGATLLGHLFAQRHIDQVLAFVAPRLMGDAKAIGAVDGPQIRRVTDAQPLRLVHHRLVGGDLLLDYRVPDAAAGGDRRCCAPAGPGVS
jgi:diaminohydroxyphosphoribosylaminopyrimidine deaminase / 5-amino-6-(5-phosphoribosylamino)uracil reductase